MGAESVHVGPVRAPSGPQFDTQIFKTMHPREIRGLLGLGPAGGAGPAQLQRVAEPECAATPVPDRNFENDLARAAAGRGEPLPEATRREFESRFGYDFSDVRVHTDPRAESLSERVAARAFTFGRNVYFNTGEFRPNDDDGRRLIAHELSHVVQQNGRVENAAPPAGGQLSLKPLGRASSPAIQRAPKCSLGHIDAECGGAAARCASIQDSYCKSKYPKPADITKLHANAVKGANDQKSALPNASDNLLHFLGNSGSEKLMSVDLFKNHKATQDQLTRVHRDKFIEGARKRIASGALKPGGSVEMVWTDTANAFTFLGKDDLGLAVGGYTLCSKVKVSAVDSGGAITLRFDSWTVQAFDCYNWDPGKGIGLAGADDNDLCCLENAGKAAHFRVSTAEWLNDHAPSLAEATISAATPSSPKQPPPKPTPPSGDTR